MSVLSEATARADDLLRQDLFEYERTPDSLEQRVLATRALNRSLLERLRLYVGVPYGSHHPQAGEPFQNVDFPGRYPTLHAVESDDVAGAATMLSVVRADVLDVQGLLYV